MQRILTILNWIKTPHWKVFTSCSLLWYVACPDCHSYTGQPRPRGMRKTRMQICPKSCWLMRILASICWTARSMERSIFFFLKKYGGTKYCWKNPKSMIFCSRVPEQLYSRLVIFSDFGLGQPKRHFFDTFFQFWPWRGPKRDKTHL